MDNGLEVSRYFVPVKWSCVDSSSHETLLRLAPAIGSRRNAHSDFIAIDRHFFVWLVVPDTNIMDNQKSQRVVVSSVHPCQVGWNSQLAMPRTIL